MPETGIGPRLFRTGEPEAAAQVPFISVIVPVRNEEPYIGQTLAQLCNQDYDRSRFEIIVADGESTDRTRTIVAAWAERHDNVHLVANPKRLSSAGRNAALAISQGDLITLVDGHCELNNANYLGELAAAFTASGADCVGRPQPLDVAGATALQKAIAVGRASRLGHHPGSHVYSDREGFVPPQSVATAYRRDVFTQVGLFDERFDACEDVEFNHRIARAGLRCFFTPRVRMHYHPRATLAGLFRQMMRYGRGRVRLLRRHPDTFTLPGFIPALWLCGLVAGAIASFFSALAATGFLALLGFYTLTLLAFSVHLGVRERSAAVGLWLPLVYLTVHLGAGVGLLWETVQGSSLAPEGKDNVRPQGSNADARTNLAQQDWSHAA